MAMDFQIKGYCYKVVGGERKYLLTYGSTVYREGRRIKFNGEKGCYIINTDKDIRRLFGVLEKEEKKETSSQEYKSLDRLTADMITMSNGDTLKERNFESTYTITFGDSAENHVGMEKLGVIAKEGFDYSDLLKAKTWFEERGVKVAIYDLNTFLPNARAEKAYVLIARKGLKAFVDPDAFHKEQESLKKDEKAFMYGRVVNKKARHNLCFGEENREPDYENKKGTIIAFSDVFLLNRVRKRLGELMGEKSRDLYAEGNYYYDKKKCGINPHMDLERKKVIAIRTGATMSLHFHWYFQGKPVGHTAKFLLRHGDMYICSEKATGNDGRKKNIPVLKHAAGADKYLKFD